MSKTVILFALALVCGAVIGQIVSSGSVRPQPAAAGEPAARVPVERSGPGKVASRSTAELDALAGIVNAEVSERRRLEQKIDALSAELRTLRESLQDDRPELSAHAPQRLEFTGDTRLTALIAAGIDEPEALAIKSRMDALDLEMMNLQYAAEQEGWLHSERFADAVRANQQQRESLRATIGEDSYDRFLYAMGQPNRVAVQDVLAGSPAEDAGLEPGDLLLSYGGQRLFTVGELIEQSRAGSRGETVTLEVLRDGRRMQIYLPRGPLGIRGGFHRAHPDDASS